MKKLFLSGVAIVLLFGQCSKKDTAATQNNLNNQNVGASANDFLSATKYHSINLEIQYMPGFAPDATALNNLVAYLNTLINKPGGINITQKQIASAGSPFLTIDQVNDIEKMNRTVFTSGTALGVYFLFTDASYKDPNVLGVSYKNTSMTLFGKSVHDNSGGITHPSLTEIESIVEEHEFGHLLGLVDLGSPMQVNHVDASHANHCNNKNCLMYWAVQTNLVGGTLFNIPVLDDNCRNDLKENGGK
jgi:hypothetical protein